MNHLLHLFWTWDSNVQPSVFRPLFEEDLLHGDARASTPDKHTFCSPFLVNALLALGCVSFFFHACCPPLAELTMQLSTTERSTYSDSEDSKSRGRRFADEAERHFEDEKDQPSIPLLQGQFAMFVYEGNLGSGAKSVDYFMRAMKTYAALNNADFLDIHGQGKSERRLQREREGLSWVMWGLYCTEWQVDSKRKVHLLISARRASQAFGFRKPTARPACPQLWHDSTFPLRQPNAADHWWFPYPVSLRTQKSMRVEIREVDLHLSFIAEDVLDYLYPLPDGLSGPQLPTRHAASGFTKI